MVRFRLVPIICLLGASTTPISGSRVNREGAGTSRATAAWTSRSAAAATATTTSGNKIKRTPPPRDHLKTGCSRFPSPPFMLLQALQLRGGAKQAKERGPEGGVSSARSWPIFAPSASQGASGPGQQDFGPNFLDFQSRIGHTRKAYLKVSVQFAITGLVCAYMRAQQVPIIRLLDQLLLANGKILLISQDDSPDSFLAALRAFLGTMFVLLSTEFFIEVPSEVWENLRPLMTRTTAWALFVGMVNLFLETGFFEKAVFQIAFVVGSLMTYTLCVNSKHELTQLGSGLYSAGSALGTFCIMKFSLFRGDRTSLLALSSLVTLFCSLCVVGDTYSKLGVNNNSGGIFGLHALKNTTEAATLAMWAGIAITVVVLASWLLVETLIMSRISSAALPFSSA